MRLEVSHFKNLRSFKKAYHVSYDTKINNFWRKTFVILDQVEKLLFREQIYQVQENFNGTIENLV